MPIKILAPPRALPPGAVPAPLCGWWYRGRSRNGHTREQRRERLLKLFGASPTGTRCVEPQEGHWRGTGRDCHSGGSADVAAPDAACSSVATWTFGNPAAVVAQQGRRKPRRLRKRITWLSACKCWRIRGLTPEPAPPAPSDLLNPARVNCRTRIPRPTRQAQQAVFFCWTLHNVSSAGVAEPRIIGIARCAHDKPPGRGHDSASLPVLVGAVVLFINDNHPEIFKRVNSAERVPMTIAASPFFAFNTPKDARCRSGRNAELPRGH